MKKFIDKYLTPGNYTYRLKQEDFDGSYSYSKEINVDFTLPNSFSLSQNYPNPFNPLTVIKYRIPLQGKTVLKVYDFLGREVASLVNDVQKAGEHSVNFDAGNLSSGIYFYTLSVGNFIQTKKLILIK